jgi:hypothetical protein
VCVREIEREREKEREREREREMFRVQGSITTRTPTAFDRHRACQGTPKKKARKKITVSVLVKVPIKKIGQALDTDCKTKKKQKNMRFSSRFTRKKKAWEHFFCNSKASWK